tara:strand:+ start:396 stop:3119 length:2724 start_codon:yes stop_codon:yes gene_type:complete
MSVQLIVYPQNYDGNYNVISSSPTEFIVNGIDFTGLNSTSYYDSSASNPSQDTIINAPPLFQNSWYRFRSDTPSLPILPSVSSGQIVFYIPPAAVGSVAGVYQKLGNLVVGQQYEVNLAMDSGTEGSIIFQVYDGTTFVNSSIAAVGTSTITHTFTATASDNTVMIYYYTTVSALVTIDTVGIQPTSGSPSGAIQTLEDGQVICDLYEEEDLPLTLSVDDFKNVAEKVQSYSKAFNLPSTKRNNRIFNTIFEVTRSDDGVIFNAYKKTQCVLKQDGFILFEGYLRLLDVTDKEGEISYNVNLYSEVIALADTLKDRSFRDLDFTELQHDYNYTNIQLSETGNLALINPLPSGSFAGSAGATNTGVLRYPFVDWSHEYTTTSSGMPKLLTLESTYRPFIKIKYLIDRIFNAPNTPFTYSSDFFSTTDFGKLSMDFNWGADNFPFTINESGEGFVETEQTATTSFVTIQTNDNNFNTNIGYSAGVYTALLDNQTYSFTNSYVFSVTGSGAWTIDFRWKMVKGGITTYINVVPGTGTGPNSFLMTSGGFNQSLNTGDTLTPEFKSASAGTHTFKILAAGSIFGTLGSTIVSTSASAATNNILLQTLRGELGQWDFLKGLITMFNLVTLVDEDNPNNIIIEPYSDVFVPTATGGETLANRGIKHDWTDKIDVSEMKLTPLTDLNKETIFKFVEDDEDYSFNQYKNLVGGHLYGSYKSNAGDEFNILDGKEEVIAEPFAATVVKPLFDSTPELITPAIYAMTEDLESESFENSPRIMYSNGQKTLSSTTFSVPAQNGSPANALANKFLQFSHLSAIPSISNTLDFHFGICQLMPGVGVPTTKNLFSIYWEPYYNELYNPNTRTMTIKVNLSPADINTFKFNDRVFIKNRVFRVNKIDYKPNDLATVEFILIP